jgi:hypothetical protein
LSAPVSAIIGIKFEQQFNRRDESDVKKRWCAPAAILNIAVKCGLFSL